MANSSPPSHPHHRHHPYLLALHRDGHPGSGAKVLEDFLEKVKLPMTDMLVFWVRSAAPPPPPTPPPTPPDSHQLIHLRAVVLPSSCLLQEQRAQKERGGGAINRGRTGEQLYNELKEDAAQSDKMRLGGQDDVEAENRRLCFWRTLARMADIKNLQARGAHCAIMQQLLQVNVGLEREWPGLKKAIMATADIGKLLAHLSKVALSAPVLIVQLMRLRQCE